MEKRPVFSQLSWFPHVVFLDGSQIVDFHTWCSISIERWQCKIIHLRKFLLGWAKNLSGWWPALPVALCLFSLSPVAPFGLSLLALGCLLSQEGSEGSNQEVLCLIWVW